MLVVYLLGVVSAAAVAFGMAVVVGVEQHRRHRRPRLFLVPSDDATPLDRALHSEIRRRARGGRPRRRAG